MPRTSFAERPSSLKVLGVGFIVLVLFFVWLTYAFFNKVFVATDDVTLVTSTAGANLPRNADVKLRGMIVGEVTDIRPSDSGRAVTITMGLKPDLIGRIPADVSAQIVPKTLFGEKYIALVAPKGSGPDDESIRAGDTIEQANVPDDVEDLLNDLYPLLTAVDPAEISYTLSAVSQALSGRGEKLGQTLVQANDYLQQINPEVPQLVEDLAQTGDVAEQYTEQLPRIARTLDNAVFTGNTIVAKRTQLAAFFDEGTRLANTLTDFTRDNGDNLVTFADQNQRIFTIATRYSNTFPCFLRGMAGIIPRLDSVFRNQTVHIDLKTLGEQPDAFISGGAKDERATVPDNASILATQQADPNDRSRTTDIDSFTPDGEQGNPSVPQGLGAVCDDLEQLSQGKKPLGEFLYPGPSADVYKLIGLRDDHNGKFGSPEDFERAAVTNAQQTGDPSLAGVDSASERAALKEIVANQAGLKRSQVPDVSALLLSPVVRGSEVEVR